MAFGLDLLLGDPLWLPHPVRWIGKGISTFEKILRRRVMPQIGEKLSGSVLTAMIVSATLGLTWCIMAFGQFIHPRFEVVLMIYFSYTILATRSLGDAAAGVKEALQNAALPLARKRLSHIVSRDTENLSEKAVIRATIETVAENTSDGIVAPLFYLSLGGPALAMAYKAVNTLDSMVGYRTPQYRDFGWASAKCDDGVNYFPARITGFLMCLAASIQFRRGRRSLKTLLRDGHKHDSPNAGIPEAATAGVLGIQLGGPSVYKGIVKEKPWLGDGAEKPEPRHIQDSIRLMRSTAILMWLLSILGLSLSRGVL